MTPVTGRTLVAGVGNIFLRDDAFGVEVARLLAERPRPADVKVADFGIRGVHLVYELLDGCDLFVLVDAAPRGYEPGTVTVIEVDPADHPPSEGAAVVDAHSLSPDAIFAMLASMGGRPGRSLVVACEPADVSAGMGLSDPVTAALPHAVRAVEDILAGKTATEGEAPVHEFGLCEGVLDAVRTRAAGRPVAGIRVRCGVRHAVSPAAMAQAFSMIAAGTEAAGAAVDVVTVPALITCRDCGAAGESTDMIAACPSCGSVNVSISGGEELILESVRYVADTIT